MGLCVMHNGTMTFRSIIDRWPTIAAFASEVGEKYPTVAAWRQRDSIPPRRWGAVVAAAQARGMTDVTLETLAQAAARTAA